MWFKKKIAQIEPTISVEESSRAVVPKIEVKKQPRWHSTYPSVGVEARKAMVEEVVERLKDLPVSRWQFVEEKDRRDFYAKHPEITRRNPPQVYIATTDGGAQLVIVRSSSSVSNAEYTCYSLYVDGVRLEEWSENRYFGEYSGSKLKGYIGIFELFIPILKAQNDEYERNRPQREAEELRKKNEQTAAREAEIEKRRTEILRRL